MRSDPGKAIPDRRLREARGGALFAAIAFAMWGLFPLYWKNLAHVSPLEVVAHRTAWSLVFMAGWVTLRGRWNDVRTVLRRPRVLAALAGTAALVSLNWLVFIWAVANDRVTEASLGYFINPLASVLLGVAVLRERLNRTQTVSLLLASAGVALMTIDMGRLPWVALTLAATFGLYGLARKTVAADAVVGLTVETALLFPLAAGYLAFLGGSGAGAMGRGSPSTDLLLVLAGAVTATPLALFALGARRLPLSTVGLLQYLAPTGQFLLAVFVYREPFPARHGVSFGLIWIALFLFSRDLLRRLRGKPTQGTGPEPERGNAAPGGSRRPA